MNRYKRVTVGLVVVVSLLAGEIPSAVAGPGKSLG